MEKYKNVLIPLIFAIFIIQICSCTYTDGAGNNDITPILINKDDNNHLIDIEELKESVAILINDDMWFFGVSSDFDGFDNKTFKIGVYIKNKNDNVDSIFIYMYPEEEIFQEEMGYTAFMVMNGSRGFYNEPSIYFKYDNETDIIKQIEELKYTFYCNDKLTIAAISKPDYQSFKDKDIILQNIVAIIPKELELLCFNSGEYKAYIRDFRKNDYRTYVVIEDNNGGMWIEQMLISDNCEVGTGRIYDLYEEGYEGLIYDLKKYKEAAVEEIDINIP
ncbi:MAG: hypothetical protein GX639_10985 [Fibrobacter sp.]|nr:hypothetical protein [Fibrobacter sp.]